MATQAMRAPASWPAGVPRAVEQCDGSWRVPIWTPEDDWHFSLHYPDDLPSAMVTRAGCGDRECIAIHQDDLTRKQLAGLRKANPGALLSQRLAPRAA